MSSTVQLDNGILNNYANEPDTYYTSSPTPYQIRRYLRQGAIATLLVSFFVALAFIVS